MRHSSRRPSGLATLSTPALLSARKCLESEPRTGLVSVRITGPVALKGRLRSVRPPASVGGRRTGNLLARFGRRSVPAGADAGRFGSPVPDGYSNRMVHDWLGAEPAPIRRTDRAGPGAIRERSEGRETAGVNCGKRCSRRNRLAEIVQLPGLRCSGRSRLLQWRVSPLHCPR
jgi:hypothetical protein